jgi:signal transduction histidine kinase
MSRLEFIIKYWRRQSLTWHFIQALALTAVIGLIDYFTGNEVNVDPFYSIPILLMVWFGNKNLAVVISVCCALAWWWANAAGGHSYSSEWLRVWDVIVRLMFFSLVVFAGVIFKQQRDSIGDRVELLERSQQLEREIISISEREQQRIGRDLHDGVCQYLAAISFTAAMLNRDLERESSSRAAKAGEIASLLQDAAKRTRDLARGLSPVDRDEGGLESALNELASITSKLAITSCSFISVGPVQILDNAGAVHLYRIAQEALNNAIKHGHAQAVVIALEACDGTLSLRVSDDGIGLDSTCSERKGMGLNIMRYRARMLAGTLEIQPNSPVGTVVTCTIGRTSGERDDFWAGITPNGESIAQRSQRPQRGS